MRKEPMKASKLAVIFGIASALAAARVCPAQTNIWRAASGEVQFGVTALVGGVAVQSPSALEAGYNGAWVFGAPLLYGMGQTFTVPSSRTLQSIQLRVAGMNDQPVTGQFEVAIYDFDIQSDSPDQKLAAVLANAQDYYQIDLTQAPVTSFDFSSFDVSLDPSQTYALSVMPTSTYAGGSLTVQAALDIYPGGSAYYVSVIPEPGSFALCGLGLVFLLGLTQRRRVGREPALAAQASRGRAG